MSALPQNHKLKNRGGGRSQMDLGPCIYLLSLLLFGARPSISMFEAISQTY